MNMLKRYFLKLLFITVSMLILSAPLVWLQIYYPLQAHSVSSFISGNYWAFTLFRWFLIGVFFTGWPMLIHHFSAKRQWNIEQTQFWMTQRFRITAWLAIFELLVCENLLFHLFALFS